MRSWLTRWRASTRLWLARWRVREVPEWVRPTRWRGRLRGLPADATRPPRHAFDAPTRISGHSTGRRIECWDPLQYLMLYGPTFVDRAPRGDLDRSERSFWRSAPLARRDEGPIAAVLLVRWSNAERIPGYGHCKLWITYCKVRITFWKGERSEPAGMQRCSNAVGGCPRAAAVRGQSRASTESGEALCWQGATKGE